MPHLRMAFIVFAALVWSLAVPARADRIASVYDYGAGDVAITGAGFAATGLLYGLAPRLIRPRCPCDPAEINAFDRGAVGNANDVADTISDVTLGLAIGTPPLVDWAAHGSNRAVGEDVGVFAEVLAVNSALVTITKHIVQRPLPRTYAGDAGSGYRSFYSGHASTTFAALSATATTLNLRNGFSVLPWAGVALVGTSVAIERVLAGRHFASDVLVGSVVGTALGIAIPLAHRRPDGTAYASAGKTAPLVALGFPF